MPNYAYSQVSMNETAKQIRIIDIETRRIVSTIQRNRGRSTLSGTARDLIRERAMQLGVIDGQSAHEETDYATGKEGVSATDGKSPVKM